MKKIFFLLLLVVLLLSTCKKNDDGPNPNDPVIIPDARFLSMLIDAGVDTNGDTLISYGEAADVTTLCLGPGFIGVSIIDIYSLTGIESFINLEELACNRLQNVEEINLTDLTILRSLSIDGSYFALGKKAFTLPQNLQTLNISDCSSLDTLRVNETLLPDLDISKNYALEYLDCRDNKLTNLDVSNNVNLNELYCGSRLIDEDGFAWWTIDITELDLSNNNQLTHLNLSYMPYLTKICVWTTPFPPAGVEVDTTGSPNVYFTTDCSN